MVELREIDTARAMLRQTQVGGGGEGKVAGEQTQMCGGGGDGQGEGAMLRQTQVQGEVRDVGLASALPMGAEGSGICSEDGACHAATPLSLPISGHHVCASC